MCHGCFDIVHWGHILHFACSRRKCDILIVSVTADKYVNKGPDRPIFNDKERAILLSGIKYIDGVYINNKNHSVSILEIIKPIELLVTVSLTCYRASTPVLSTS